nr:EOG090X08OG [Lepidurus arcticus]
MPVFLHFTRFRIQLAALDHNFNHEIMQRKDVWETQEMASPLGQTSNSDAYDPIFSTDINQRMQVPKRITFIGMKVPDRIFVDVGAHEGMDARPPREFVLDSADLPVLHPTMRVQTPPSKITLDMHPFPTATDTSKMSAPMHSNGLSQVVLSESKDSFMTKRPSAGSLEFAETSTEAIVFEEMDLLRQQVAKLNRRVISLELEAQQRQQRDIVLYTMGVAYVVLKAIIWLSKD